MLADLKLFLISDRQSAYLHSILTVYILAKLMLYIASRIVAQMIFPLFLDQCYHTEQ